MFGVQSRSAKQMVMKQIMNTRMSEGTPVRDHMIKMIGLFNELGDLSVDIDWETQNNMVLETLPPSFNHFKLNYFMNKLEWSLTELMQQLQIIETIVKGHPNVNFVLGESSKPPNGTEMNKANQSCVHAKPKIAKKARPFDPDRKPKRKCFKCGQKGHWKKDCPKLKGQSSNFSIAVIQSCFVTDSTNSWWIDSGVTDHICNSLQGFRVIRSLNEGEMQLKMISLASISIIAVGDLSLSFSNNSILVLHDCLFVPNSRKNLI